jgi:SAM-dependent methyltransferase
MHLDVSPDKIMQYVSGHWAAATLSAAVTHSIFTHLESGRATPEAIAKAGSLSVRGVEALLDGLVGIALVERTEDGYRNTREASAFLVEGKPTYLGAIARRGLGEFDAWKALPEAVRTGASGDRVIEGDDARWKELISSLAPLAVPPAEAAVRRLGFAKAGPRTVLDVGGGSGIFATVLLRANSAARATQVDFPSVNAFARRFVAALGVGDRFDTIDSDYREVELGEAAFDVVVLSHVSHIESRAGNAALFPRLRRALKPGGTLVINDFVIDDGRTGPPGALLFHVYMLLHSREGATYRMSDYRTWLGEAGFPEIGVEPVAGGMTLIFAQAG